MTKTAKEINQEIRKDIRELSLRYSSSTLKDIILKDNQVAELNIAVRAIIIEILIDRMGEDSFDKFMDTWE